MKLYEKYRPMELSDLIGQPKAVKLVQTMLKRPGFDGDVFWLTGASGTGKTSMAWIIARQLCADDFCIDEIDGDTCTVDRVHYLREHIAFCAPRGRFKAYIVNEAHAMTPRAVQAWLTLLERVPANRLILFTTTAETCDLFGSYGPPFFSRCKLIRFTNQGLADAFALRAQSIARAEGLDGQPLPRYKRLIQDCKNNMRAALQQIECGAMMEGGAA